MKNLFTNNTTTPTKNMEVLSINDLTSIFGGNDDVINPEDLLGDGNIIEDITNI
jgi:hypothetical protein